MSMKIVQVVNGESAGPPGSIGANDAAVEFHQSTTQMRVDRIFRASPLSLHCPQNTRSVAIA